MKSLGKIIIVAVLLSMASSASAAFLVAGNGDWFGNIWWDGGAYVIPTDAGAWWTEWNGQEDYPVIHSDSHGSGWNMLYIDGSIGWERLNEFLAKNGAEASWDMYLSYIDE